MYRASIPLAPLTIRLPWMLSRLEADGIQERLDQVVVMHHLEVQMGIGRVAGTADQAQLRSRRNCLPRIYPDGIVLHVVVNRLPAVEVVDDDVVAPPIL